MTRRPSLRLSVAAALATLVAAILLAAHLFAAASVAAVWVLVLGALALGALTRLAPVAQTDRSRFEAALEPSVEPPLRPPALVRTERELVLGIESAGHLHLRLLPVLREAAAARLAARHHVDLDERPQAARALLGEEAWELLRPDRPAPEAAARTRPATTQAELARVVDALERL